jgi:hypothetical protein
MPLSFSYAIGGDYTATTDEVLAKIRVVQGNIKKLVDNNGK